MNKDNIIVTINNIKDIGKINKNTKYVNLCIDNVDVELINYFLINGKDYLYSDSYNSINGFIYVDYNMFIDSEKIINNIIDSMSIDLSCIEKIRYVYLYLGKILSTDINVLECKNEVISFSNISTINNIWGSIYKKKVTNMSIAKIFMYVLARIGIKSEIVNSSFSNIGNKVYIDDNNYIVVNLFSDLPYIQGGFITKYFDKYNNDKKIDMKNNYIDDEYTDYYLQKALSDINCLDANVVEIILAIAEKYIDAQKIGTMELYYIYKNIFNDYLPNYDVKINNLYVNDNLEKKHFIVISYGEEYYSFNYSINNFIKVRYEDIYKNIENKKIGLYVDEDFIRNRKEVVL